MELLVETPFIGIDSTSLTIRSRYLLESDPSAAYLRTLCKVHGASMSGISNNPDNMLARLRDVNLHTATERWKVSCGKTVGVSFVDTEDALWVKYIKAKLSAATRTVQERSRFNSRLTKPTQPMKTAKPQPSIKGAADTAPSVPPRSLPQSSLARQTRSMTRQADIDSRYYLAPSFDLNILSVPRLRTILVEHSIPYSTSASKEQLIKAITERSTFNEAQAHPALAREKPKQTTTTSPQPRPATFRTKRPNPPTLTYPVLPTSDDQEPKVIKDATGSGPYIKAHNDYVAKIQKINATSPLTHRSPPGLHHPVSVRPAQERLQETQEVTELIDQMVHLLMEDQKQYAKRAEEALGEILAEDIKMLSP